MVAVFSLTWTENASNRNHQVHRRAHVFPLKNDGTARLDFKLTIEPDAGPYVVEPAAGTWMTYQLGSLMAIDVSA